MTNSTTFPGTVTASGFTGTSTNATNAVLATDATNASRPVIFGTATTGNVPLKTDPGLVYNPSTNKLTAGAFVGDGSELTGISAGFDPDVDIIKIGNGAGTTQQGANAIAIGHDAGSSGTQGASAVAIGLTAGQVSQGDDTVAIGIQAGQTSQGANGVAVGRLSGNTSQGGQGVAIGFRAGNISQGASSVAIGQQAAQQDQGVNSVAIGYFAGSNSQGDNSVAIGWEAGKADQGDYCVAIGNYSGASAQSNFGIGIGWIAGRDNQSLMSIAIGAVAAHQNQHQSTICINATGSGVNTAGTNRFLVAPIRNSGALSWDSNTKEIYGNSSDDRVKYNESYIKNALKTIMKLKPQTYDKCADLDSSNAFVEMHESGFIAQDIWYDVPEMKHIVILAQTANPTPEKPPAPSDDPRDDPDYSAWGADLSTLNYTQVIPFLTKAVQEISVEVPRAKTTVSNTWGQNITGLVVSANTNKHKTNTVPIVNLSTVSIDKSWYGVVSKIGRAHV